MKKIVLTAAALLLASGVAFAGSDHFGSDDNHGSNYSTAGQHLMTSDNGYSVDLTKTNGIGASQGEPAHDMPAPGYGQGIWGR